MGVKLTLSQVSAHGISLDRRVSSSHSSRHTRSSSSVLLAFFSLITTSSQRVGLTLLGCILQTRKVLTVCYSRLNKGRPKLNKIVDYTFGINWRAIFAYCIGAGVNFAGCKYFI